VARRLAPEAEAFRAAHRIPVQLLRRAVEEVVARIRAAEGTPVVVEAEASTAVEGTPVAVVEVEASTAAGVAVVPAAAVVAPTVAVEGIPVAAAEAITEIQKSYQIERRPRSAIGFPNFGPRICFRRIRRDTVRRQSVRSARFGRRFDGGLRLSLRG